MTDIAKMTSKGQVTIPLEIREALGLSEGSKLIFTTDDSGRVYIFNASLMTLKTIQENFKGEAEKAGFKNEQDVVDYIRSLREENRNKNENTD